MWIIKQAVSTYLNIGDGSWSNQGCLAEGVGFEPTKPLRAPAFETSAIDHYATLPDGEIIPQFADLLANSSLLFSINHHLISSTKPN